MFGTLLGVGIGPGDPQLMTFKTAQLPQQGAVTACVVGNLGQSFARQVAATCLPASMQEQPRHFSMSPRRDEQMATRGEAAHQVLERFSAGQDVAFITESGPLRSPGAIRWLKQFD